MGTEAEFNRLAIALGMASFQAQSLEHSMVSLYASTFVLENGEWDVRVREIMDTRYTHTLGRLIRDAAKELNIPSDLSDELEIALNERNWVTHHFFREYGAIGMSDKLLAEATERLEKLWPYFERIANQVNDLVIKRRVETGLTKEQVLASIERALGEYIQEKERT
jgi:hypothetical protein